MRTCSASCTPTSSLPSVPCTTSALASVPAFAEVSLSSPLLAGAWTMYTTGVKWLHLHGSNRQAHATHFWNKQLQSWRHDGMRGPPAKRGAAETGTGAAGAKSIPCEKVAVRLISSLYVTGQLKQQKRSHSLAKQPLAGPVWARQLDATAQCISLQGIAAV